MVNHKVTDAIPSASNARMRRPETELDLDRVHEARRKLKLGLLDQPEVVDQAVDELLAQYLNGSLDLVSIDGEPIDQPGFGAGQPPQAAAI